jgi:hypothetical protein
MLLELIITIRLFRGLSSLPTVNPQFQILFNQQLFPCNHDGDFKTFLKQQKILKFQTFRFGFRLFGQQHISRCELFRAGLSRRFDGIRSSLFPAH